MNGFQWVDQLTSVRSFCPDRLTSLKRKRWCSVTDVLRWTSRTVRNRKKKKKNGINKSSFSIFFHLSYHKLRKGYKAFLHKSFPLYHLRKQIFLVSRYWSYKGLFPPKVFTKRKNRQRCVRNTYVDVKGRRNKSFLSLRLF